MRTITNTAGETEPEKRSRRWNRLEGLGVITLVLVLLWPVAYAGDILGGWKWITPVVQAIIALVFLFMLVVSPRIHGDILASWGLGHPRTLFAMLSRGNFAGRVCLRIVVVGLFIALNLANYTQWPHVVKAFDLHKLGLDPDPLTWREAFPGRYLVVAAGLMISTVVTGFLIRYDNFFPALKTAIRVSLPFLAAIFLAAWLHRGGAAFENLSLSGWALGVVGYVFWGAIQQIVFSGYFGGRFRKGFAPGDLTGNQVPMGQRWKLIVKFGGAFAVLGICVIAGAIARTHGVDRLNPKELLWLTGLLFIGGAAYGRWYCRDKRRLLVATLAGACFGLIHIDSFGLVLLTWGLGTVLVYVFMEDANRNVVALGFVHGLLGSTLGALFSKDQSGGLEIDYHVGPWNIEEPNWGALIFPMICIVFLIGMMIRLKNTGTPRQAGSVGVGRISR